MTEKAKPTHRATYAADKRNGGYLIRVQGPYSNRFAGREVPVTLKSGEVKPEHLEKVIWTGKDEETGQPVTLYSFERKPQVLDDEIPF